MKAGQAASSKHIFQPSTLGTVWNARSRRAKVRGHLARLGEREKRRLETQPVASGLTR